MEAEMHPTERLRMQVISAAMLGGASLFLLLACLFRMEGVTLSPAFEAVRYVACGLAVLSPLIVAVVERYRGPAGGPSAAHIVSYGIFEGLTLFCGTMVMVGGALWPLAAAAVPLGAMVLRFPRAS